MTTTNPISDGLVDFLSGDSLLASMLPSYGGKPAVFAMGRVPGTAPMPHVVIPGNQEHTGALDGEGDFFRIQRPVWAVAAEDGDDSTVEAVAERVRALFAEADAAAILSTMLDGYAVATGGITVEGPVALDRDEYSYGRVVTVRLYLIRQ